MYHFKGRFGDLRDLDESALYAEPKQEHQYSSHEQIDKLHGDIRDLELLKEQAEKSMCRYENTPGGCARDNCPWQHKQPRMNASIDKLNAQIHFLEGLKKRAATKMCKYENDPKYPKGCTRDDCTWQHEKPKKMVPPHLTFAEKSRTQCKWELKDVTNEKTGEIIRKGFCTKWTCPFYHQRKQQPHFDTDDQPDVSDNYVLFPDVHHSQSESMMDKIHPENFGVSEKFDMPVKKQGKIVLNDDDATFSSFNNSLIELEKELDEFKATDGILLDIRARSLELIRGALNDEDEDDCKVDHSLLTPQTHCPNCDLFVCKGNSTLSLTDAINLCAGPPKDISPPKLEPDEMWVRAKNMDWGRSEDEDEN
uniref:C3H1-type domain-containing protein n=1 Tax=viral metagenome TaxID=1070528 RepID=A0A6C0C9A3_9ZZZZ